MRRALISLLASAAFAAGAAPAADPAAVFARVGETSISVAEFEAALADTVRRKFYHRQVPAGKLEEFQREVAESLIERALLLAEARRRGAQPDREKVEQALAEYEGRYAKSEQWRKNREALLPELKRQLEERDVLERLRASVHAVEPPPEGALREYYEANPKLFTEPEQTRLSVILLKVDPSAPRAAWDGAMEEARAIRGRIASGADFAELARIHSNDVSAAKGGDMGYLHKGMVPEAITDQLAGMKAGELSEPVRILEGIALFRFEDRKAERLRAFDDVRERAGQLWRRAEGERRWSAFLAGLRRGTPIQIDTARYPALAGIASGSAPGRPAQ
jgi:parvulin-like peptidyl-prolyl isomerase